MPHNAKSDIDFQPKTKEYSYSTKATTSKKYGIYLLVGIVILIIILLSALAYLNNSGNVKTTTTKEFNLRNKNPLANDPKFKNYTKLGNQATDAQMSNYTALINEKEVPLDDPKYPEEIYGIFSGFDEKYIQVVTYNGVKNLAYDKNLQISKAGTPDKPSTSSAVTIVFLPADKNTFLNPSGFGKILHLSISLTTPETIQQIYLNE